MPNLSRRHLVTSAAALPALAVPALASDTIGPNHPDAELLRLGAELEALIAEYHAQCAIDRVRSDKWDAACEAAGLLPPDIDPDGLSFDEVIAYRKKRNVLHDNSGNNELVQSIAWIEIAERQFSLVEAIMAHKPRTIAGVAVIARAFTLHHSEVWHPFYSDDDDHHRTFMEAVCACAGVVPAPLDAEAVQS